jgi:RND family efflux transporter MFP subunit
MSQNNAIQEPLPPVNKTKVAVIAAVAVVAVIILLFYNKNSRAAQAAKPTMYREVPVSVARVERKTLREGLSLVGTVVANNDVNVMSETTGRIIAVRAQVGDFVQKSAVLVQVDDEMKQAAFTSAEVNYEKAKKDWERYQALYDKKSITASQYDQARLAWKSAEAQYIVARRQLNDTRITSPIQGYVTARPVDVGAVLQNNTMVANVVDISTLKVKLNVAERDAFLLKKGDAVEISTDVYPGVTFAGTINSIAAKGDEAHTYPVEIILPNPKEHQLKAGMFARIDFTSLSGDQSLALPRTALVGSIKTPQVYVVKDGKAFLRQITVTGEAGDTLGVRQGVLEGDQVVINGQNNLRDSASVQIVQ